MLFFILQHLLIAKNLSKTPKKWFKIISKPFILHKKPEASTFPFKKKVTG